MSQIPTITPQINKNSKFMMRASTNMHNNYLKILKRKASVYLLYYYEAEGF